MKSRTYSRRTFVGSAAALPLAMRALAQGKDAATRWILLGTDKGKGIYRATWNATTGEIGPAELAVATERPTFFAMHPKMPILYAANEADHGDGWVSSFRVAADSVVTAMQRVSSQGNAPCYVSVDLSGRAAFVANYNGGSLSAYTLGGDGSLREAASTFHCKDKAACGALGPMKARQDAAHLHCATVAPKNDFLLVCNLGEDAIEVFPIAAGLENPVTEPTKISARAGSGPRHVGFHPNGRWVYCIHELDCTIDLYDWKVKTGKASMTLREGSVVSTLAAGGTLAGSTACEILVSDDGRFVYANTRGENSLVVFRVDPHTGLLTEIQRLNAGGTVTRQIAFDPSRKWLLAMHQGVGGISVFSHDAATGKLGETPRGFAADTPMCVQFV